MFCKRKKTAATFWALSHSSMHYLYLHFDPPKNLTAYCNLNCFLVFKIFPLVRDPFVSYCFDSFLSLKSYIYTPV